jgi:hypothetical protein
MEFKFRGITVKAVPDSLEQIDAGTGGCRSCAVGVYNSHGIGACPEVHTVAKNAGVEIGRYCMTADSTVGEHGHYFVKVEEQQ